MARRKVYPQIIAIELIIIAAAAVAIYYLAPDVGVPHAAAMFVAGMGADRCLILVLRHRNKKLHWKSPITITRKPARRPATRKAHH
jgi:hypothetical protein